MPLAPRPADSKFAQETETIQTWGLAHHADLYEDPYEDVLCEEVSYHEGPFLLSSGIGPEAVYVNRLLIQALLLSEALPVDSRRELNLLAGATLKLSNHVLHEAGVRALRSAAAHAARRRRDP